jgi:NAD(P)-dependent dehydrogenase (short-subunit alcohol dehydrogenase family)
LLRENLLQSSGTKVIGPTMLAKYFAPQINPLTRGLAVELAQIRVNAISPGVIDTGAWDSPGCEGKCDYFEHIAAGNPVRRIGTAQDVAAAAVFAMTNTFMTGMTLRVDGGEPLA